MQDLKPLVARFLGPRRTERMFEDYAASVGAAGVAQLAPDARLVQFVETQLTGAIGSASARAMVASVVEEEPLAVDDVMRILDEASQLRAYSRQLEEKSQSLERATNDLRAANEQLKSLDHLKDDFMSSVTHELRTPLTSIRALAEMMEADADMPTDQRQQFLGIVVSETERLSRLVNQVLDLAKIESGSAEWRSSDVDLREVVKHAAESAAPLLAKANSQLSLHLPDSVPTLGADRDRLLQVMLNLLSNAAKFVPSEGGRVDVKLECDANGATVQVCDNGPGVALADQQLVFEKFRQVGAGRDRPHGTGLGLPICREIVEHFGGRIWLHSIEGQGACFAFWLPWHGAAKTHEAADESGAEP